MNKAVKIIIAFFVVAIVLVAAYNLVLPSFADISIGVMRGSPGESGKYMESVMLVYSFAPSKYKDEMNDFSTTCGSFHEEFINEHKDDGYKIKADVKIENKKTVVTYTGTITEGETGIEKPFEKEFVFDYVFTKDVG